MPAPRSTFTWSLLLALTLLCGTVPSSIAWSRAGGGDDYGGSSSSSGSGGSDYSSGGDYGSGGTNGYTIFDLVGDLLAEFAEKHPAEYRLFVFFFLIFATAGTWYLYLSFQSYERKRDYLRLRFSQEEKKIEVWGEVEKIDILRRLMASDPAFHDATFLARVRQAFVALQNAWSEQKISQVRSFLSDGMYQRLSIQVGMQIAQGCRNELHQIQILDESIVAFQGGSGFDRLDVRISASMVDYYVSLEAGSRIRGSLHPSTFTEYWTFHRRHGVTSQTSPGSLDGSCPQCSQPIPNLDSSRCDACNASVVSGEYDWVLTEITQESVWCSHTSTRDVSGLERIQRSDPGLCIAVLEDQVSTAFWRLRAAEFYRDLGLAKPVLSPTMAILYEKRYHALIAADRVFSNVAIGAVQFTGSSEDTERGVDKLEFLVKWSVRFGGGGLNETYSEFMVPALMRESTYVLIRDKRVLTNTRRAFSANSCLSCGAPIALLKSDSCSYCHALLVNGNLGWVVDEINSEHDDPKPAKVRSSLEPITRLAAITRAFLCDGKLDGQDHSVLRAVGHYLEMRHNEIEEAIQLGATIDMNLVGLGERSGIRMWARLIAEIALEDGHISAEEETLLEHVALRVNLSRADLQLAIEEERRDLVGT